MHPPLAHGFPGLVRKKADWSDWVVSPVWIVTEPVAKKDSNRRVGCVPNMLSVRFLIALYLGRPILALTAYGRLWLAPLATRLSLELVKL